MGDSAPVSDIAPVYDPAEVTAEWLGSVLSAAGVLDGARVVGFDREDIGTGQVGANVRFRLVYDHDGGAPPGSAAAATEGAVPLRPASVVGKFAAPDETSRAAGIATRTYQTEVDFYRDLAPTVDISRPACYFAAIEPGTADVVLLLEDMAPAEQGDQIAGCTVAQAELVVDEAARLHGPRWGDPSLRELGWLAESYAGRAGLVGLYDYTWGPFVERYEATLAPGALEVGQALRDGLAGWVDYEPAALTVIHGDYRLDNMLFGPPLVPAARPLTVVDWQTVRLGVGTADVAYFLGAGLESEVRRAHEHDLVARYHRALEAYGVTGYPFDACWEDYRRYSFSGYFMAVIASILVGRTDRGDQMFMAMANRHAAQVHDLDAQDLL
jgi:hypothetical protein